MWYEVKVYGSKYDGRVCTDAFLVWAESALDAEEKVALHEPEILNAALVTAVEADLDPVFNVN